MTDLIYSLEETAAKLGMSEPVLVRLSQYFRIPQAAYESEGYLSFKGDLSFTHQDLQFFRRVQDRIVNGESLSQIKSMAPAADTAIEVGTPMPTPQAKREPEVQKEQVIEEAPEAPEASSPLQSSDPFEEMAAAHFNRYKAVKHDPPPQTQGVFQKLVAETRRDRVKKASVDQFHHKAQKQPWNRIKPGFSDSLKSLFPQKPLATDPLAINDLAIDEKHVHGTGKKWPRQELPQETQGRMKQPQKPVSGGVSMNFGAMPASFGGSERSSGLTGSLQRAARQLRHRAMKSGGSSSNANNR